MWDLLLPCQAHEIFFLLPSDYLVGRLQNMTFFSYDQICVDVVEEGPSTGQGPLRKLRGI